MRIDIHNDVAFELEFYRDIKREANYSRESVSAIVNQILREHLRAERAARAGDEIARDFTDDNTAADQAE